MGGDDFFSNGIHLNVIEAADDPADGVLAQPPRDQRHRARDHRDRLARRDLRARRRRRRRRRAFRARGRPRRGARGRGAQSLLPAHGRPVRLRVLDLPAAAPRRRRDDRPLTGPPFTPVGTREPSRSACSTHAFGADLDELSRRSSPSRRAPRARPRPDRWLEASGARAPATSRSSRSARTARRSSRARTGASSATTAATTRRAAASSTSFAACTAAPLVSLAA